MTRYDDALKFAQDQTPDRGGRIDTRNGPTHPVAFAGFVVGYDHATAKAGYDYRPLADLWSDFSQVMETGP